VNWPGHRLALTLAVSVLAVWVAGMALTLRVAALKPDDTGTMLVVFAPGTEPDAAFTKLVNAGGTPVRRTWLGSVWVVTGDAPGLAGRLMQQGAMGAYRDLPVSPELAGCFAYADAKMAELFSLR
jgi:hypothetical protein